MKRKDLDDPDLPLDALLAQWPVTIGVFLAHKMACVGCLVAPFHTVVDGCHAYGLDQAGFRAELRLAAGL